VGDKVNFKKFSVSNAVLYIVNMRY